MFLLIKRFTRGHNRSLPDGRVVAVAAHSDSRPSAQPDLFHHQAASPPPEPEPLLSIEPELHHTLPGAAAAAHAIAQRFFPHHRLHLTTMREAGGIAGQITAPHFPHLRYGAVHFVPPTAGGEPDLLLQVATTNAGKPRLPSEIAWTLLHELGHAVQLARFEAAPEATRQAVIRQWRDELAWTDEDPLHTAEARSRVLRWTMPGSGPRASLDAMPLARARASVAVNVEPLLHREGGAYYHQFEEWFAERFAAWATSNSAPRSAIEHFFSESFAALRDAFRKALHLLGQPTPPACAFERWASATWREAGGGDLRKTILVLGRNSGSVVTGR